MFHFAAYAAEGLSPFIRNFNYRNNVIASANIINYCVNNNCKLIFTSSMAVYGDQDAPFTERMTPKPIDPYGIAKYAIEMDIQQASHQFGLKYNKALVCPENNSYGYATILKLQELKYPKLYYRKRKGA